MRNGLLGSLAALAASAGLALAQGPRPGPTDRIMPSITGPVTAVSPLPIGAPAPVYEPLYTSTPGGATDSPAVNVFGNGMDPNGDASGGGFPRMWAQFDYLLFFVRPGPENSPLIVSGNIPDGPVPGTPGSLLIFGGKPFMFPAISGARATVGGLFPGSNRIGAQASGLILPTVSVNRAAASGPLGIPTIGTTFVNDITGAVEPFYAASVANPGSMSGSATTMAWTAEIDLFANLYRGDYFTINMINGFKFFSLAENIILRQNRSIGTIGQTFMGAPLPVGAQTLVEDNFSMMNRFYGWQIGLDFEYRWRCLVFNLGLHSALGNIRNTVEVSGVTQATTAAGNTQVPGGLFAQLSNIGRRIENNFGWVPEVTGQVGYQLTQHARLSVGYTFFYANNVVRPGPQIDPRINPALVPTRPEFGLPLGSNRPAQEFIRTEYWAQGVNWALSISY